MLELPNTWTPSTAESLPEALHLRSVEVMLSPIFACTPNDDNGITVVMMMVMMMVMIVW